MRDEPLLPMLDEPTVALVAETEHDLFERFADQSRASTALGRIVEWGSHTEPVARSELYAEL